MIKFEFLIKTKSFPHGNIYRAVCWINEHMSFQAFKVNYLSEIKKAVKAEVIHSIDLSYLSYTNSAHDRVNEERELGKVFIRDKKEAGVKNKKTNTDSKGPVTDVRRLDLPNISDEDLELLAVAVEDEKFKREHHMSDDAYDFYLLNQDIMSIEEAKEYCSTHSAKDMYGFRKRKIREKLTEIFGDKLGV